MPEYISQLWGSSFAFTKRSQVIGEKAGVITVSNSCSCAAAWLVVAAIKYPAIIKIRRFILILLSSQRK